MYNIRHFFKQKNYVLYLESFKMFFGKYGILETLYLCLSKPKEYKYIQLKMHNPPILRLL